MRQRLLVLVIQLSGLALIVCALAELAGWAWAVLAAGAVLAVLGVIFELELDRDHSTGAGAGRN